MWLFRHSMQHHHPALAFRGIWLRGSSHGSGLPSCTEVDFCRCPDIAPRKNKVVCFFLETRNNLQRLIYRNNLIVCIQAAVIIVIDIHVHLKQYPSKWNCLAGGATKRSVLLTASHPALSCHHSNLLKSLPSSSLCSATASTCTAFTDAFITSTVFKLNAGCKQTQVFAVLEVMHRSSCTTGKSARCIQTLPETTGGKKSKSQSIFFRLENNLKPRYLRVIMIHWSRTSLMLLG